MEYEIVNRNNVTESNIQEACRFFYAKSVLNIWSPVIFI